MTFSLQVGKNYTELSVLVIISNSQDKKTSLSKETA